MSIRKEKESVVQRALARERLARAAAESLLETKSSELYESNQQLVEAQEALEQKVIARTEELKRARDEAIRLMEERTVFLARISHELRTPLNSILGIVQLMLQEESREQQRRKLETVNASSMVLLTMINKILDFTKIEAGESAVDAVATDVGAIVDDAVDMLAHTAASKGIALYTQKRAGFPEQVITDPSRLTQIVLNLLGNALKFTSEGSVTINLDVQDGPEAQLLLSVTDTGVGVHPDRIEKIFLPFKQSDEGQEVHSGGTGLGLSIVQQSVKLLRGEVTLESTPGQGSTFTVRCPIGLVAADKANLSPSFRSNDNTELADSGSRSDTSAALSAFQSLGESSPLRILVADDNEMNRSVIEMQLEYLGYQADFVANGEEVVRAVTAHRYDLVLMDISMPLMNGEEACRAIRRNTDIEQPVVVAVTASALAGDRERYLAGGMDHYLPKPVDSLELARLVKKVAGDVAGLQATNIEALQVDLEISESLIDLDELGLRLGGMLEPMLVKVGPIFIAELPGRLIGLQAAWESGNVDELIAYVHSLKGSAASVGATTMVKTYSACEIQLRSGNRVDAAAVDQLVASAQATAEQLTKVIAGLKK